MPACLAGRELAIRQLADHSLECEAFSRGSFHVMFGSSDRWLN